MELTPTEKQSALWRKIDEFLGEELLSARIRLENPSLNFEQTQLLRGQVQLINRLKDLNKDKPFVA